MLVIPVPPKDVEVDILNSSVMFGFGFWWRAKFSQTLARCNTTWKPLQAKKSFIH